MLAIRSRAVMHGLRSAAMLVLPCGITPAVAQQAAGALAKTVDPGIAAGNQEIIVTATRREESLQKVPLSVTAISSANLESRNVRALSDIEPGQVPSVIFQPFSGHSDSLEISIRGVGTNDPEQGTRELPVPLYIDGVYLGRAQGTGLQLIDPERVEVLRGPQGTLFGRNAEGGAVQFVTKKPTGILDGYVTGTLGNLDYRRIRATVDLPTFVGFKVQVAGLYSDRRGLTRNDPADSLSSGTVEDVRQRQQNFANRAEKGLRAAVRYDAVDNLTLDYVFDISRASGTQGYLAYRGPAFAGGEAPSNSFVNNSINASYQDPFVSKVMGFAFTAAYVPSDAITLKSISSYRKVSNAGYSGLTAVDVGPAFGLPDVSGALIYPIADQDIHQHQLSQEGQLLGSWDRFQLTAGVVYYHEAVTQAQHTSFFGGPGLLLIGLPADFSPGPLTAQRSRTNSLGVYAQATYKPPVLNDELELTAGLRYSHDRKTSVRFEGPADPANPFDPSVVSLDQVAKFSADRVDPAFTIKYNVSPLINVYARYAQAYRAGGVNVRSVGFEPYDAEVTKEFELGLKAQTADHRLTFDAAVYQNKIHGPQFDVAESPVFQTATVTINAPVVNRIRGVELETTYRTPIKGLSIGVNYAYLKVKLPAFINPTGAPAGLVVAQPLFAPRSSGSINVDYRRPVSVGTLALHADYAHSSKFFVGGEVDPAAGAPTPTPPIITRQLNARLAIEDIAVGKSKLTVALWVKNLLNRDDFAYSFRLLGDDQHGFGYYTDPRTYGIDVGFRF